MAPITSIAVLDEGVPMARIAKTASALDFLWRDQKLVALAGADHELPLPARSDLAGKRVFEMAMAQAVDDQRLNALQCFARLTFLLRWL
jgi:hypothetical protein